MYCKANIFQLHNRDANCLRDSEQMLQIHINCCCSVASVATPSSCIFACPFCRPKCMWMHIYLYVWLLRGGGLTSWLRTALRPAFCTLRGKCLDNIEMIPVIAVMFRTCGCVCYVWALCVRNVRTNLELVGATAIQRRTSPLDECSLLMSWHTGQLCA